MNRILVCAAFLVGGVAFAIGCSHQTEFYGGHIDIHADNEFQRPLGRRDVDVKACYAKVAILDDVPLEMVVDPNGRPLAARALGPLFGSTLGGCLETVAFRITLAPGNGNRIAHATAAPHPIPAAQIVPSDDPTENLPPPAVPTATEDGGMPAPGQSPR